MTCRHKEKVTHFLINNEQLYTFTMIHAQCNDAHNTSWDSE